MMDYAEKMQKCHEYVEALEEERRKIQVFQRELPLCLELVTQAIEACRRELSGTTAATAAEYMQGQSECSGQTTTSSDGTGTATATPRPLVLEEFIPIKRTDDDDDDDDDDDEEGDEDEEEDEHHSHNDQKKKADWLRSVQLWSPSSPDPPKEDLPKKVLVKEVKRNGGSGAFKPFHKEKEKNNNNRKSNETIEKTPSSVLPASTTSSSVENGTGNNNNNNKEDNQNQRKQRRCWSPELHRRFLHALQQLGGSHAATPKQIRELMKVDGLTNDEVKSHLQKYRLHTRRPSPAVPNNNNPQAPQFVVVGGIWVQPPEYATTVSCETPTIATATAANGIFAPVPPLPTIENQQRAQSRSHSEGRSDSPATSSSTHTATSSPVF